MEHDRITLVVKTNILSQAWKLVIWWRHQMETFSALLAICAGNSPVTGEFPAQRSVRRSFDVFFDLRPNKRLSKLSWGWWFETLSRTLWRQCNEKRDIMVIICHHSLVHFVSWLSIEIPKIAINYQLAIVYVIPSCFHGKRVLTFNHNKIRSNFKLLIFRSTLINVYHRKISIINKLNSGCKCIEWKYDIHRHRRISNTIVVWIV